MKNKFHLNVALASSKVGDLVAKGPIDFDGFVREFRTWDWASEVNREYWSRKSTPLMSVTHQENGSTLWASAWDWLVLLNPAGGPKHTPALSFIVGLDNGPKPPDIYCRKENRKLENCEFSADSPQTVEDLFWLYFQESYNALYKELFSLYALDDTGD